MPARTRGPQRQANRGKQTEKPTCTHGQGDGSRDQGDQLGAGPRDGEQQEHPALDEDGGQGGPVGHIPAAQVAHHIVGCKQTTLMGVIQGLTGVSQLWLQANRLRSWGALIISPSCGTGSHSCCPGSPPHSRLQVHTLKGGCRGLAGVSKLGLGQPDWDLVGLGGS